MKPFSSACVHIHTWEVEALDLPLSRSLLVGELLWMGYRSYARDWAGMLYGRRLEAIPNRRHAIVCVCVCMLYVER